jgi:hypothetical protein
VKSSLSGYLSIRSLPPELERKIVAQSRQRHISKSRMVIAALGRALNTPAKEKRRSAVGKLFGRMHPDDLRVLDETARMNRQIEPELWP